MNLRQLAITTSLSFGLVHQTHLRALRNYIKTHTDEELAKEVKGINEVPVLRTLWEAGLSAAMQDAVLDRLNKLTKRGF